jgi:hypothetical protein
MEASAVLAPFAQLLAVVRPGVEPGSLSDRVISPASCTVARSSRCPRAESNSMSALRRRSASSRRESSGFCPESSWLGLQSHSSASFGYSASYRALRRSPHFCRRQSSTAGCVPAAQNFLSTTSTALTDSSTVGVPAEIRTLLARFVAGLPILRLRQGTAYGYRAHLIGLRDR